MLRVVYLSLQQHVVHPSMGDGFSEGDDFCKIIEILKDQILRTSTLIYLFVSLLNNLYIIA